MKVFIDTSAWIALFNKKDQFHDVAVEIIKTLERDELATSDFVLGEFLGAGKRALSHTALIKSGKIILRLVDFLAVDKEVRKESLKKWGDSFSKAVSFVDWSNFVLMNQHGIDKIFAFDEDFLKMGLKVVP